MRRSRLVVLLAATTTLAGGCDTETDAEGRANQVVNAYLRAAANGDIERLCALRTEGALRWWGGRTRCERRAQGIAVGPVRRSVPQTLLRAIKRKALKVDAATAKVLPADTSEDGDSARIVVDFGKAFVEDGHAVGGEIIEIDLKVQGGAYRVARVGFASFTD